jgi:hypothetical protein
MILSLFLSYRDLLQESPPLQAYDPSGAWRWNPIEELRQSFNEVLGTAPLA